MRRTATAATTPATTPATARSATDARVQHATRRAAVETLVASQGFSCPAAAVPRAAAIPWPLAGAEPLRRGIVGARASPPQSRQGLSRQGLPRKDPNRAMNRIVPRFAAPLLLVLAAPLSAQNKERFENAAEG